KELNLSQRLQKLSDLGCATSPIIASIYDDEICIGDPRYAAPEVLYGRSAELKTQQSRRAMDIYHLGSMIFFLITGRMLTPEVISRLAPEHRPPNDNDEKEWRGSLSDALPYWREAWGRALEMFVAALPKDASGRLSASYSEEFLAAVQQLTEPDPALRG